LGAGHRATGEGIGGRPHNGVGDPVGAADRLHPTRDRPQHRHLLLGLVEEPDAAPVLRRVDLAGEQEHRRRGERSFIEAGNGVGSRRTGADERDPEAARDPGVGIGGVDGGLLVTHGHEGGPPPPAERLEDRQVVDRADSEHDVDAERVEAVGDEVGAASPGHGLSRVVIFGNRPIFLATLCGS
jgi:hypothetical protein